jgi:hypothetical protein
MSVSFTPNTANSAERTGPYERDPTRQPRPFLPSGWVDGRTGNRERIPEGSQTSEGRLTGDFRGIGVVNPWGGRKTRRSKNCSRKRMSKRMGKRMGKRMDKRMSKRMSKKK